MTTVRGLIRSTATITADGTADDQSTARERAVAGLDLTTHELVQANTPSVTPPAAPRRSAAIDVNHPASTPAMACRSAMEAGRSTARLSENRG